MILITFRTETTIQDVPADACFLRGNGSLMILDSPGQRELRPLAVQTVDDGWKLEDDFGGGWFRSMEVHGQ